MQKCDNCGYLIPPAWAGECKRCAAALAAPEPARAAAAPAASTPTAPAAPWLRAPAGLPPAPERAAAAPAAPSPYASPIGSPSSSGYDASYAAPARIGLPGAPTSNGSGPFNPYERVPTASSQWSSGVTSAKRPSGSLKKMLALTLMLVGGFMGWKYVQAWRNAVPEEVQEYVDGGGVQYAPPGQGYSIRLPEQPVEQTQTENVGGATMTVNIACIEKEKWEACVGMTQLPIALSDADAEAAMRQAITASSTAADGTIESTELTTHDGEPAMEAKVKAPDGYPAHIRVVLADTQLFMLVAHSSQGTEKIYDEMVESLTIGTAV